MKYGLAGQGSCYALPSSNHKTCPDFLERCSVLNSDQKHSLGMKIFGGRIKALSIPSFVGVG